MKKTALFFDGGGEHGLFTLRLVRRIDDATGILQRPKIAFGGTSFGDILASALATGVYTPYRLERIMIEQGPAVFTRNWLSGSGILGPKYTDDGRAKLLKSLFGQIKMSETNNPVYATTFNLEKNETEIIGPGDDMTVFDACMASSAAPTYWNPYKGHIDGGVVAGNPSSLIANTIKGPLNVISIGTGKTITKYNTLGSWGLLRWAKHITSVFQRAEDTYPMPESVESYIRVNGVRPDTEMDDASTEAMQGLLEAADLVDISEVCTFIKGLK